MSKVSYLLVELFDMMILFWLIVFFVLERNLGDCK